MLMLMALFLPTQALAQESQRDRGILQSFLEDNLSAAGRDIRIEGFSGALSGRATIEELTIADSEGVWLTLRGAVLDWNRAALLAGRLEVAELSAEALIIPRAPVTEPEAPAPTAGGSAFALPDLPVAINIGNLALERVELGESLLGQDAVLRLQGNAQLADGSGTAELRLERIDATQGEIELTGSFDNATRDLALNLRVQEGQSGIATTLLGLPGQPAILLQVAGEDPIDDFQADIRLATDGQDRLTGTVTLATETADEGTTRRIAADVSGDIAPVFAPQYRPFFGPDIALRLRAIVTPDGERALEELDLRARSLTLTGTGAIAADGWPRRVALQGRIADPDGNPVRVPVGEGGTELATASLSLDYDRAADDAWQFRVDAREVVQADGTAIEDVTLDASGQITVPEGTTAGAVDGRLQLGIDGLYLPDPRLAAAVGDTLSGQMSFDWVDGAPVRLSEIALSGTDYGLTGAVTLDQPDEGLDLLAELDATLAAQDLSRFAPLAGVPLSGAARLAVTGDLAPVAGLLDLRLDGGTTDLALDQPRLDPLLAGEGQLSVRLRRDMAGTAVEALRIATDHATITGAARLGAEDGDFEVNARIPEVGLIADGLQGAAELTAQGNGTSQDWDLRADATLPGQSTLDWQGRLTGLDNAPQLAGTLKAEVGALSGWSALAGRPLGGSLGADADISLDIDQLAGAVDLTLQTQSPSINVPTADQILRGAGRLTVRVTRNPAGRITVENANLSTPELTAQVDGSTGAQGQSVTAEIRLRNGGILAPELAGPVTVQGTAQRDNGTWRVDVDGTASGGTTLAANGTMAADFSSANLGLDGRVPLALANGRLRPRAVSGTASYDLRLSGPLALSSLSGRIETTGARFALPDLSLALEGIDARIDLSGGRAQLQAGTTVSTGGRLQVSGGVGLTAPFNADLAVQAQTVGLRQARLFETTADGTVTLQGPLTGGARIAGVIDLGSAELRIPASSGATYADLPGLRHVNEPADVRRVRQWAGLIEQPGSDGRAAGGPAFPIDLLIRAPSRIFVRGRGLDAELGGQLRLLGTTAALVPQGRFELIRGRFDVLGQRLVLDEGFVNLRGSFDPYLRFVATTQTERASVVLGLEGVASEPELLLSSVPELPQDEILSLLLFGRDITEISPLQALRLANALRTLSGRGGAGVTGRLRESLALDDLDVSTDAEGNVEARAGKYLSENIYSDVVVNGAGETEINLNLEVSPSVTLRGRLRSDGDTGLGVYFERDY